MTTTTGVTIGPPFKALLYRLVRFFVRLIARPTLTGTDNYPSDASGYEVVYVLHHRALTDLAVLELSCAAEDFTSPFQPLAFDQEDGDFKEAGRFLPLLRSSAGRMTMREHSQRLSRLADGKS